MDKHTLQLAHIFHVFLKTVMSIYFWRSDPAGSRGGVTVKVNSRT
jgi:hypothetical protein